MVEWLILPQCNAAERMHGTLLLHHPHLYTFYIRSCQLRIR